MQNSTKCCGKIAPISTKTRPVFSLKTPPIPLESFYSHFCNPPTSHSKFRLAKCYPLIAIRRNIPFRRSEEKNCELVVADFVPGKLLPSQSYYYLAAFRVNLWSSDLVCISDLKPQLKLKRTTEISKRNI